LSVVLFVVLKLEKQFTKEDEDKEEKEDNVEDKMKNMPEKKKAICETVHSSARAHFSTLQLN
jgi:hypothetical protein